MDIRLATFQDLAPLRIALEEFYESSNWLGKLSFCADHARDALLHMFYDEFSVVAVAMDGERVVGFGLWGLENPWTIERVAIEILFFVSPEYRNAQVSASLLRLSLDECKKLGAKAYYSSSTAGFDDEGVNARAYKMMLGRAGFVPLPQSSVFVKFQGD